MTYFRRVSKDYASTLRQLDANMSIAACDEEKMDSFRIAITPNEGLWKGATFHFSLEIPEDYPIAPPKVRCLTKVYHPNLSYKGGVCLNILKDDYSPVLSLKHIVFGLSFLFYEPNFDDPLNHGPAQMGMKSMKLFEINVSKSLRGHSIDGERFERLLPDDDE